MRIAVCGMAHQGVVTAACLAEAALDRKHPHNWHIIGYESNQDTVAALEQGKPPIFEPGLADLVASGIQSERLSFTRNCTFAVSDGFNKLNRSACDAQSSVVWIAYDTPIDARGNADVEWVLAKARHVLDIVAGNQLVVVSSQLPAGTVRKLAAEYPSLRFACVPENLQLGKALDGFRRQSRIVVGLDRDEPIIREWTDALLGPFTDDILYMSIESAEMVKHALNGFLATSVVFANEVANICADVGADAMDVARALKSDPRIGPRAYLSPGMAYAGGHLERDVRFLRQYGDLFGAVHDVNEWHRQWPKEALIKACGNDTRRLDGKTVAVLGLTYKPFTDTLEGSDAMLLCEWLHECGAVIWAYDPAVKDQLAFNPKWTPSCGYALAETAGMAVHCADAVVIMTPWPEFALLTPESVQGKIVIDPGRYCPKLNAPGVKYITVGR